MQFQPYSHPQPYAPIAPTLAQAARPSHPLSPSSANRRHPFPQGAGIAATPIFVVDFAWKPPQPLPTLASSSQLFSKMPSNPPLSPPITPPTSTATATKTTIGTAYPATRTRPFKPNPLVHPLPLSSAGPSTAAVAGAAAARDDGSSVARVRSREERRKQRAGRFLSAARRRHEDGVWEVRGDQIMWHDVLAERRRWEEQRAREAPKVDVFEEENEERAVREEDEGRGSGVDGIGSGTAPALVSSVQQAEMANLSPAEITQREADAVADLERRELEALVEMMENTQSRGNDGQENEVWLGSDDDSFFDTAWIMHQNAQAQRQVDKENEMDLGEG